MSPETIQTEDNLLFYCHDGFTLDDQEEMTECLPSKVPNSMRLLKPKKRFSVLYCIPGGYVNTISSD